MMLLPSPLVTWTIYSLISQFQPQYTNELNFASAKVVGFGVGSIIHLCCWITGTFSQHIAVVKARFKELFADVTISVRLAMTWYWKDIKTNGVAFWIDFAVIVFNFWVFADALLDFLTLMNII